MTAFWTLERTARLLPARRRLRKSLPALLFFTDPTRTPDPVNVAERLPPGSAVVYRHFGAPEAEATALSLLKVARRRGLKLLIGADAQLATRIGADGVHLPERLAHQAAVLKQVRPDWLVTSAAHAPAAARRSRADAVVLSVAFPSRSPSARTALGPIRLALRVQAVRRPAYALGGVNANTARRLIDTGVIGVAAVDGFRT